MNFVTASFFLFFLGVLAFSAFLRRGTLPYSLALLTANFVFYAFAGLAFIPLLLFVAFCNWASAFFCYKYEEKKKWIIATSVSIQISILAFYKYYEFFLINIEKLLHFVSGASISLASFLPQSEILLPVGLSFYIFQGLSYSIDLYREKEREPENYFHVLLFISFFPTIMAGPIMRSADFFQQLRNENIRENTVEKTSPRGLVEEDVLEGLTYILSGLFKKVVLASYLSEHIVRDVFLAPEYYSSGTILIACYAYAMQIYCDFSGYTDLALGAGRLMGYKLPQNFNAPYLATSLQDFWRRWHISLSTWLRDYLYIPLGGSKRGNRSVNLLLTMVIGGLWHGSHIVFLVWGFMHGVGLGINHAWKQFITSRYFSFLNKEKQEKSALFWAKIYSFASWFLTFHFVVFLWIFFRADSTETAFSIIQRMVSCTDQGQGFPFLVLVAIFITMLSQMIGKTLFSHFVQLQKKLYIPAQILLFALLAALIMKMGPDGVLPFIYFQF